MARWQARRMDEVIMWASFAGGWLLVAGPLYQGSIELSELDFDREGMQGIKATAAQMAHRSPRSFIESLAFWLPGQPKSQTFVRHRN